MRQVPMGAGKLTGGGGGRREAGGGRGNPWESMLEQQLRMRAR